MCAGFAAGFGAVSAGMTEDKKAQPDRWPPGRRPASKWWLLAKHGNFAAVLAAVIPEQSLHAPLGGSERALLDAFAREAKHRRGLERDAALHDMLQRYSDLQATNEPVHTWPVP